MEGYSGTGIPYGDLNAFQRWYSPYYKKSHFVLREALRTFYEKELSPFASQWDEARAVPLEIIRKCGEAGILGGVMNPWEESLLGKCVIAGVEIDEFDTFHTQFISEEMIRNSNSGVLWGILSGCTIGVPPMVKHGSDFIRKEIAAPCLKGLKTACLAITEPWAGSDVSGIKTSAILSPCGKFYIVNGMKKWITSGIWSDYFTTAVVTDPEAGMFGVSLLVIESNLKGVSRRKMLVQG